MAEPTLLVAFVAGIGSFVAPCILPMVPAFLAYISGTTASEIISRDRAALSVSRASIVLNTVFFVVGFSAVFSVLGVLINSILSDMFVGLTDTLNIIGGSVIISFGAFLLLSSKIRMLNRERKFFPKYAKSSYPMSFVFGMAFAIGWTPCVGPVLGTILTLAGTLPSIAFGLLLSYSLGLGIPFVIMGTFYSQATRAIHHMTRHLKYYNVVLGAFIIVLGTLVLTNQLAYVANFPLLNDLVMLG